MPRSADFAHLAKRISAWTTNCLVSLMVLVVGVLFARQVLQWWAEDPSQQAAGLPQPGLAAQGPLTDSAVAHVFEFGDSAWALARRSVAGSRADAERALRASCLEVAPTAGLPPGQPGPDEQRFLDGLAGQAPAAEVPGKWQLFEAESLFPTAAVVHPSGGNDTPFAGNQVAAQGRRVVAWAMAVPHGETKWTVFVFHSPAPSGGLLGGLPEIPLPPDSSKVLSIRAADGEAMVAFGGAWQADRWKRFYDRWFSAHGWLTRGDWRAGGGGWHQRYVASGGSQAGAVEVRFGPDGKGGASGLLLSSPDPQRH